MKHGKIKFLSLFFCAVGVVSGPLRQRQFDVTSLTDATSDHTSTVSGALLACQNELSPLGDDGWYLVAGQCSHSYVVCHSGSVVYAHVCPPGTRFHVGQRICVAEEVCRRELRSADRDQIKYFVVDAGFDKDFRNSKHVARRQIKFESLSPPQGLGSDSDRVRRQIKFRSLPDNFDAEAAILGDPPYDGNGGRHPRQIKFRSLSERADEAKKHDRRQVKLDALTTSDNQPSLITYWYKRR